MIKLKVEQEHSEGSCEGCFFKDTCLYDDVDKTKTIDGIEYHCDKDSVIYVEDNSIEEINPMPELKAGMVVDYANQGLYILLPDEDDTLGLFQTYNGFNNRNVDKINTQEIKTIYTKPRLCNYGGVIGKNFVDMKLWNKIWEKQTPEQAKLSVELKDINEQLELLEKRKAEIKECI